MKPILVTCYVNPDIDGVAGAIGYAEFLSKQGKSCEAAVIGEMHEEARYVFDRFHFSYPSAIADAENYEEVILVDASDLIGLEGKIPPEKVIEIIDHRKVNESEKFPKAKVQIELVGAAATLIAEKFMENGIGISKESATLICAAIISNTLNFQGTVTTDRDIKAFNWLNEKAELPEFFWKELFAAKSDLSGKKLIERIEGDFASFVIGGKSVGIAQIEMIGVKKLIEERGQEIIEALTDIKKKMNFDFIFQNTIELDGAKNFFITDDVATKGVLEGAIGVHFDGIIAERPNVLMRKQIVPLLKEYLEK